MISMVEKFCYNSKYRRNFYSKFGGPAFFFKKKLEDTYKVCLKDFEFICEGGGVFLIVDFERVKPP